MSKNDDDKNDPYQGVKIQRLPTLGKAISYKTWKQGHRPGVKISVKASNHKKLQQIANALKE